MHEPAPNRSVLARRQYSGPAFLSGAFRPFFLGASVWAVVGIAYWLAQYNGFVSAPEALSGRDWHIHEMIFGFAGAAMGGFILTAVPNWTGRLPVRGWPLGGLALLWLMGRVAMLSGHPVLMLLDIVFLFVLATVVAREIIGGRNKRNLVVAGMISLMALANLWTHLKLGVTRPPIRPSKLSNTANANRQPEPSAATISNRSKCVHKFASAIKLIMPAKPSGQIDKVVMLFAALALLLWVFFPVHKITGVALVLAGLGHAVRLARWQGLAVINQSIIVVLHIAYAWLALGFGLLGLSILWDGFLAADAIHALTIGAVGMMIAAMMSRASFGHSGLPMRAGWVLSLVYLLVGVAAVLRLAAGFFAQQTLVNLSGLAWSIGFALFVAVFMPLYFKKRR